MNKKIYLNGKFVDEEKAVISVRTHALQYGTGCFEGIRAYYNSHDDALYAFRMKDHYKRLERSCKVLFISLPHNASEMCDITIKLLKNNFSKEDMYVRPFAYKSDLIVGNFNLRTLKDGFCIYSVALGRYIKVDKGIRANISSWIRVSDNSITPKAKITGSYVNTSLAKTESAIAGFDETLMPDFKGNIVEGSAENLFMVRNNKLITPPTSDDILEGITRDTVKIIAKEELGLDTIENSISRTELYQADEVFLVGTGAEITQVIEIDGRLIGNGEIGPITKKVKELYYKIVHGESEKYSHFLTKISKS